MGDFNVDVLKDNNQAKKTKKNKNKNNYISWINSNENHNLMKTLQKLDFN
jgi:hypothetical protein